MNNKHLIKLGTVIAFLIAGIIIVNIITSLFESDEKIENDVRSEYLDENYTSLDSLRQEIKDLTKYVKQQRIENVYTTYVNNVVADSSMMEQFSKSDTASYWFYSYADQGFQDYKVIKMKGVTFDFDKAMKVFRKDGNANTYGGINSIKRITYKEYLSAHKGRRK